MHFPRRKNPERDKNILIRHMVCCSLLPPALAGICGCLEVLKVLRGAEDSKAY